MIFISFQCSGRASACPQHLLICAAGLPADLPLLIRKAPRL